MQEGWAQVEKGWAPGILSNLKRKCLTVYQNSVREAKSKYFSNLIAKNANRPKVLFKTINSVLSPIVCSVPDVNIETCTQVSEFFVQKIQDIRSHLSPFHLDHSHLVHSSSSFTNFQPVSSSQLLKIISQMKFTFCQSDVWSGLFREVLDIISPTLLAFINSSLINGVFTESFKHEVKCFYWALLLLTIPLKHS